MFDQDLSRFATLIIGVGEVYDKSFTHVMIEVYWNVLKAFKYEEVNQAIKLHLENPDEGRFLPKPADIIMAIEGSSQNQALRAWSKIISTAQRIGVYTSVAFDDPLIHAVAYDMGGWRVFCAIKDEQLPFVRREFQDRYRGYVSKKPLRHPKYLTGIIEHQNSIGGYNYDPPILIGDKEKARQVIATGLQQTIFGDALPAPIILRNPGVLKTPESIAKITGKV
jgi:hypothetical protein